MRNNRKLERKHLVFYLRVFEKESAKLLGYVVDITPQGMMLISENPVEKDSEYTLTMDIGDDTEKQSLEFKAVCKWCKVDVNPKFYAIGFHIYDISPEIVKEIEMLISDFGFEQ